MIRGPSMLRRVSARGLSGKKVDGAVAPMATALAMIFKQ